MSQLSPTPHEVLRQLQNRPLCIICSKPKEAQAIAKGLGVETNRVLGREIDKINDGHTFFTGSFDIQGQNLDYYITSSLRQGIQSFTIHASILFHILKPRFTVHVGVCAAFYEVSHEGEPNEKLTRKLGDVIFGEAAINFEEGKWEQMEGDKLVFRPDFDIIRIPTGDMQAFAESDDRPRYHYGDYISGSAVRSDASAVFNTIRNTVMRNTIALDMEASAFLKLCTYAGVSSLGVVKGISNFGNAEKGEELDAYEDALKNTAIALEKWVIHTIPAVKWELYEDDQNGVAISFGYYDDFIKVVLDSYSNGLPAKKKVTSFEQIPWEDVLGLKIVMPKDMNPSFFSEAARIGRVMRDYKLLEIDIGGYDYTRSLYYKAGYLIDFPRIVNSLSQHPDAAHQVDLFGKRLKQKPFFNSPLNNKQPLALLCSWEDFIQWLEGLKEGETASIPTEAATYGRAIESTGSEETARPSLEATKFEPTILLPAAPKLEFIQANVPSGIWTRDDNGDTPVAGSAPTISRVKSSIFRFLKRAGSL